MMDIVAIATIAVVITMKVPDTVTTIETRMDTVAVSAVPLLSDLRTE